MKELKLRKKDVAEIVSAAYPEYNGRKFRLLFQEKYHMSDYWSGGSRTYVTAVKVEEGRLQLSTSDAVAQNPFNKQAHIEFDIPRNAALIEHQYFCGKDLGIRVVVHPDTTLIPKLLPACRGRSPVVEHLRNLYKENPEAKEIILRLLTQPADIEMNTELHEDDLPC